MRRDWSRNPLTLAIYEIKRFRGFLPRIAVGFILLIPLLYGCIYLAGNWDPYGRLDELPVAVVNRDLATTVDGVAVTAGQDFVDSLHDAGTFRFIDTDDADAADGLEHGRYYLVITVPENFSADLVSGRSNDPQRAEIMLRRNDANGFVIGTITNSAQNSIAKAIDQTATRSYFEAVFANLATIRQGMQDASNGAAELSDGLASAHDGSGQLRSGLAEASSGADQVADGASRLASGAATAASGSTQLASGLDTLSSGAAQLADGAGQVADGTQQIADIADPVLSAAADQLPEIQDRITSAAESAASVSAGLASGADSIASVADAAASDLDDLLASHPELASDPAVIRLKDRLDTTRDTADSLHSDLDAVASHIDAAHEAIQSVGDLSAAARDAQTQIDALNAGARQVATGASDLQTGAAQAATAGHTLASGLGELSSGASELSGGAGTLASGVHQLSDGAVALDDGLAQLADGSQTLATGLAAGVDRLPVMTEEEQQDAAQVLSAPVDVTMEVDNPAHVYGRGLAPMFFSIALWVMGISAFFLVRPITGRVIAGRATDLRIAFTAWLPLGVMTVVAGWLMLGATWVFLGLDPVHPFLIIGLVTLIAMAFSAVAHLLRTALGMVSTAAMLVLLIVQLTAAGGTYPPELLPPFFAAAGGIMPMHYTIDAFRIAISGGLMQRFALDVALMVILFSSCLALLVVVVHRKRQFRLSDLHPPLG